MKSWADHCSSDEESFNEDTPLDTFDDDDDEQPAAKELEQEMEQAAISDPKPEEAEEPPQPPPEPRTYDFPSGPPFTLFVGNLSYNIKDGQQLGDAVADLVKDRLQQEINVVRGKIGIDRQNPGSNRHKGFGYVEVSSLEEVSFWQHLSLCECL